MSMLRRRPRRAGGQSLVEFALVLPIIVLLIFGVLDAGVAVFRYNTLSESARQANRLAIVNQDVPAVKSEAVAFAPVLNLTTGDVEVCFHAPGAIDTDCSGDDTCGPPRALGCLAYVEVSTTYTPITPLIGNLIGTIDLDSTSVGPIEYVCPNPANPTCQ
ncbi:hypothetical protein BH24CHL6_BH24CHL6_12740 [soil metagenome]